MATKVQMPRWRIHHGDGIEHLMAHGPVDHVITDTPYAAEVEEGHVADRVRAPEAFGFAPMTDDLRIRAARAIAYQCRRWALIFTSDDEVPLWRSALEMAGMIYYRRGLWIRLNTKPQIDGTGPAQGDESIVIAHSRSVTQRWNGGGKPAVWYAPIVRGASRVHPTQKPETLMRQLVEDFTDEGETIFDPYNGSGTTGAAAIGLGRNYVGCDTDAEYCKMTRKRLSMPLFDGRPHRHPVQNDMFRPPKGAVQRERMEFDRAILNYVVARGDDGVKMSELVTALGEPDENRIRRSLQRLQRNKAVRREGRTVDTQYYPAEAPPGATSVMINQEAT